MTTDGTWLKGEVGGKRAHIGFIDGAIRIQVLSIVSQKPEVDRAIPVEKLREFYVDAKSQWIFGVLIIAAGIFASWASSSGMLARLAMFGLFVLMGGVALVLGRLMPSVKLRVGTDSEQMAMQLSSFSRKNALRMVEEVRRLRPDLPAAKGAA